MGFSGELGLVSLESMVGFLWRTWLDFSGEHGWVTLENLVGFLPRTWLGFSGELGLVFGIDWQTYISLYSVYILNIN